MYSITLATFFRHQLSCIATVIMLRSLRVVQKVSLPHFTDLLSLNRNGKVNCENCGTQTT